VTNRKLEGPEAKQYLEQCIKREIGRSKDRIDSEKAANIIPKDAMEQLDKVAVQAELAAKDHDQAKLNALHSFIGTEVAPI